MATQTDITAGIYVGANHQFRIPVVDANGAPQTMTGWTLKFTVRRKRDEGTGELVYNAVSGGDLTTASEGGTNNVAVISTAVFPATPSEEAVYEYALWRTDTGLMQPLKYGDLIVTAVAQPA